MKSTVIASILLLGTASAVAVPGFPEHMEHAEAPKGDAAMKRPCSQAEVALATGIHLNIQGQYGEFNGTKKVEQVEQAQKGGPSSAFYEAKGMLEADVQEGMNLRQFNQQIAPPGNPAIPGLAQCVLSIL